MGAFLNIKSSLSELENEMRAMEADKRRLIAQNKKLQDQLSSQKGDTSALLKKYKELEGKHDQDKKSLERRVSKAECDAQVNKDKVKHLQEQIEKRNEFLRREKELMQQRQQLMAERSDLFSIGS